LIPIGVYVASWVGWFVTPTGYDRQWAKTQPGGSFDFIPGILRSWWHYHAEILNFHTHLTSSHPYSTNPWSWLIMGRPTSFFYETPKGAHACGAANCAQEVLALGTPFLWWSGVIAIAIIFGYWISRREWQSGLLLLSLAAGYLPWFLQKRTVFTFYVIAFEPFVILIIVYCLKLFLEPRSDLKPRSDSEPRSEGPDHEPRAPHYRQWISYAYLGLVAANFFYFLPLFVGGTITYDHWSQLMWLQSWI
jgi:dolichyl-phosphate-mannose--protein O-mannosyl transferase